METVGGQRSMKKMMRGQLPSHIVLGQAMILLQNVYR